MEYKLESCESKQQALEQYYEVWHLLTNRMLCDVLVVVNLKRRECAVIATSYLLEALDPQILVIGHSTALHYREDN